MIGRFLIPINDKVVCLGGGDIMPFGWINMDFNQWKGHYSYPNWYIDIVMDFMEKKPFPFKDEGKQCFYCANMFEHLPKDVIEYLFREISRCLLPGGYFRVEVPVSYEDTKETIGNEYDYSHTGSHITAVDFEYLSDCANAVGLHFYKGVRKKSKCKEMRGNRFDRRKNMLIVEMRKDS
jgi:predicted SAM-dependent methyltransferase